MTGLLVDATLLPPFDRRRPGTQPHELGNLVEPARQDLAWRAFLSHAIAAGFRVGIFGERYGLPELHARVLAAGVDYEFLMVSPLRLGAGDAAALASALPGCTTAHVVARTAPSVRTSRVGHLDLHHWSAGSTAELAAVAQALVQPSSLARGSRPGDAPSAWRALLAGSPRSRRDAQLLLFHGAPAAACLVRYDRSAGRFGLPAPLVTRHEVLTDEALRDAYFACLRRLLPLQQHRNASARFVVPFGSDWGGGVLVAAKDWGYYRGSGPDIRPALFDFPAAVLAANLQADAARADAVVSVSSGVDGAKKPGRSAQHLAGLVAGYLGLPAAEPLVRTAHGSFDVEGELPPRVLLVDEQFTSGKSMRAARTAFQQAGVQVVAAVAWSASAVGTDPRIRASCWHGPEHRDDCPAHGHRVVPPHRGQFLARPQSRWLDASTPTSVPDPVGKGTPTQRRPLLPERGVVAPGGPQPYYGGCRQCGRDVKRPVEEVGGLCPSCWAARESMGPDRASTGVPRPRRRGRTP